MKRQGATLRIDNRQTGSVLLSIICSFFFGTVLHSSNAVAQPRAYITNRGPEVVVVNTATNQEVTRIPVMSDPRGIAASPDGSRVYVAGDGPNTTVIDTASNLVVATIPCGVNMLAVSNDGARVYATSDSHPVCVIDSSTNTATASIESAGTWEIAVSPDGTRAYGAISQGSNPGLSVIDTASNTVITTIPIEGATGVAVTPDGSKVLVATFTNALGQSYVFIVNTVGNTISGVISVDHEASSVVVSPDGSRAYVAHDQPGSVSVVDIATETVIATISLESSITGLAVTADGRRVYVPVGGNCSPPPACGFVAVIETATNTVTRIGEGGYSTPFDVVIAGRTVYGATIQPPINSNGSSVFNGNRGVVPVKFTLAADGVQTCLLPPSTIAVARIAGGTLGQINESEYVMPSDQGSNFRITGCQYVYNLNSRSLGVGTYLVEIKINNDAVGMATFSLR